MLKFKTCQFSLKIEERGRAAAKVLAGDQGIQRCACGDCRCLSIFKTVFNYLIIIWSNDEL
jgi:hypothetical protein